MIGQLSQHQIALLRSIKTEESTFRSFTQLPAAKEQTQTVQWEFDCLRDIKFDGQHDSLRNQLFSYRKKANKIYRVDELLRTYDDKFNKLTTNKNALLKNLQQVRGQTSQLVARQKSMLDLSIALKEVLDYYHYFSKFQFNWACQIGNRELFQGSLQEKLSELEDGLQFTRQNSKYVGAKKLQAQYQGAKAKIISFTRSFFVKLLNCQNVFVSRTCKSQPFPVFDSFFIKPRIRFVTVFLLHFPHFKPFYRLVINNSKQGAPAADAHFLQDRQIQIQQFQLSDTNLSLIGYLQHNQFQSYSEAILNLLAFNRTSIHQMALHNYTQMKQNDGQSKSVETVVKERYFFMSFMLAAEHAYFLYCGRVSLPQAQDHAQKTITQISRIYQQDLRKVVRYAKEKDPFAICQRISQVPAQFKKFLQQHTTQAYKGYVFGPIRHLLKEHDVRFLQDLIQSICLQQIKELQAFCVASLPKINARSRNQVTDAVRLLMGSIPRLRHCAGQSQRYLLTSLQTIVKAVRQVNPQIESRLQCYVWNIEVFSSLRAALRDNNLRLVRKEYQIDTLRSVGFIQRVKSIEQSEGVLKYAQDLFSIITTGMPVINELTMDYSQYIMTQYQDLQVQFVKDILFIYSKQMIQFLQKLTESEDHSLLCTAAQLQNVYSTYILNIQKYIADGRSILKARESFAIAPIGAKLLESLFNDVYERMFDLLDIFYKEIGPFVGFASEMEEICLIKDKYPKKWT